MKKLALTFRASGCISASASTSTALRRGYSLVEVIIASTILVIVMGLVINALVATKAHESSAAAEDDLAADAQYIRTQLSTELTLSGWHIPDGTTSTNAESALDATGIDAGRLTRVLATDRTRRYFPYVIGTGIGTGPAGGSSTRENPTFFPYAAIDPSLVVNVNQLSLRLPATTAAAADLTILGPTAGSAVAWYGSHLRPNQSLIFLRAFTYNGTDSLLSNPDPNAAVTAADRQKYQQFLSSGGQPQIKFGAIDNSDLPKWQTAGNHSQIGVSYPSPLYESSTTGWTLRPGIPTTSTGAQLEAYGVPLEAGYITLVDGALRVQPQWETCERVIGQAEPPRHVKPADENGWREYIYTVVTSPRGLRHGRLVRAYKALRTVPARAIGANPGQSITSPAALGSYEFVVDRVLSDSVSRIVFDTWRTDRLSLTDPGRLDINQIRVRVFMARPDQGSGTTLSRILSFVITMRAKNTELQRGEDAVLLGLERPGYPR